MSSTFCDIFGRAAVLQCTRTYNRDPKNFSLFDQPDFITSPNFPKNYLPSTECVYTINVPENYKIVIEFLAFDLEEPTKFDVCEFDKLSLIIDLDETYEFCGNHSKNLTNFLFVLSNRQINLKFETDALKEFKGFNISVSYFPISYFLNYEYFVTSVDSGIIYSPNSLINQPFLPQNFQWTTNLEVTETNCLYLDFRPLATNETEYLISNANLSQGETCSVQFSYTTEIGTQISNEVCFDDMSVVSLDVSHSLVKLYFSIGNLSESAAQQINLPSFSVFYTMHQNSACIDEQTEKFSLAQVGLWFIVSISAILIIFVFSIQGFVKHCVESRKCCYKFSKNSRYATSRRNSASVVTTPKSTRQAKKSLSHRGKIAINFFGGYLIDLSSLAPHNPLSPPDNSACDFLYVLFL